MPGQNHHHRAGSLRQSNKKNKRSTTSKRSLNRMAGGKISISDKSSSSSKKKRNASSHRHATHKNGLNANNKAKRLLLAKQRRDAQRKKQVDAKRLSSRHAGSFGATNTTTTTTMDFNMDIDSPKLIGVISLSAENNDQANLWETQVYDFLYGESNGGSSSSTTKTSTKTNQMYFKNYKKNPITILTNSNSFSKHYHKNDDNNSSNPPNNTKTDAMIMGALDLCRICDVIVFALNGDLVHETLRQQKQQQSSNASVASHYSKHTSATTSTTTTTTDICDELFISERGEDILSACKAQGLPTVLTILTHSDERLHGASIFSLSSSLSSSPASVPAPPPLNHREKAKIQKRNNEMKRFGQRLTTAEFGEDSRFMDVPIPTKTYNDLMETSTTTTTTTTTTIIESKEEEIQDMEMDMNMDMEQPNMNKTNKLGVSTSVASHAASASTNALIRFLCTGSASPPKWIHQMPRPYLMTSSHPMQHQQQKQDDSSSSYYGHWYETQTKELHISGYVRGKSPLCIYNLMHVPLLGTFAVSKIDVFSPSSFSSTAMSDMNMNTDISTNIQTILPTHANEYQDSLEMYATPDALEGEQNLIGFDEANEYDDMPDNSDDDDDDDDDDIKEEKVARPAGWSDYQSAWLDGVDTDRKDYDEDYGELAKALNSKNGGSGGDDLTMDGMEEDDDDEDQEALEQKRLRRKEDLEFPDEVEVKQDETARDRFARYRSLKSFRKSYWDPKENLPESYARIYHFASFKNTQKDIMADQKDIVESMLKKCMKDSKSNNDKSSNNTTAMEESDDENEEDTALLNGCVYPGSFVKITLANVPEQNYRNQLSSNAPISAVSLLPHENKVSVIHMGITSKHDGKPGSSNNNTNDSSSQVDETIKSKDTLIFRCGWRTWQGRPVFSQNNLNSDKHKLERFLPPSGAFLAASTFGPVCYSPCPVLCFSKKGNLVAVGSIFGADADRIVIKRIVLTGFPTRVHKRHATVKYMFYNPEDVKWFKPAGLTTKHGLQGNIMESVGDHGTMKCLFNQPVKQHDTICLPLYKRIYPKFAPQTIEDGNGNMVTKDLVVL